MLTFQIEKTTDCRKELESLLDLHWAEVALDKDAIKLNPDWGTYAKKEEGDCLTMITARNSGKLIGYYVLMFSPHIHYSDSLTAFTDVYYILPEYRKGRTGIRLFQFMEDTAKARGVQRIIVSTKIHLDKGKIWEYLGYKETERVFTKCIGG